MFCSKRQFFGSRKLPIRPFLHACYPFSAFLFFSLKFNTKLHKEAKAEKSAIDYFSCEVKFLDLRKFLSFNRGSVKYYS